MKQISFSKLFDPNCKMTILHRILEFQKLEKKNKGDKISCRNLLNKWFQDSVKNYIMDANAGPLLFRSLQMNSIQEIKQFIHNKMDKNIPKYMGILHAYYEVLTEHNKAVNFCSKLLDELNNFNALQKTGSFHKKLRKQFVCLLILTFFEMKPLKTINCFADLWNLCFDNANQQTENQSKDQEIGIFEYSKITQESLEIDQASGVSNSDDRHVEDMSPSEITRLTQPSFEILENNQKELSPEEYKRDQHILEYTTFRNQYDDDNDESNNSYTPIQAFGGLDQAFIPDSYNYFAEDFFEQHTFFPQGIEQSRPFSQVYSDSYEQQYPQNEYLPSIPLELSQNSQNQLSLSFNQPSHNNLPFSQSPISNSSFSQSSNSLFSQHHSFIPFAANSVKQQQQAIPQPLFLHQF